MTGKADTGALRLYEDNISSFARATQARERRSLVEAEAAEGSSRKKLTRLPDDLRALVAADERFGEPFAVSYLDNSRFDTETKTIHPRTLFARGVLRERLGGLLANLGYQLGDCIGGGT